jgi:hypothetical protein
MRRSAVPLLTTIDQTVVREGLTLNRDSDDNSRLDELVGLFLESLILAQDERWRRA